MRQFYTADLHLGHAGVLGMCDRPFATIEEHDRAVVDNWNARVGKADVVWFLGDFAYRTTPKHMRRCFEQLNGSKNLILGNHDHWGGIQQLKWNCVTHMAETVDDGTRIVMCHYSLRTWPGMRKGSVQLYGHSHGRLPGTAQCIDVGVDNFGYAPATIHEIRARLAQLPPLRLSDGDDQSPGLEIATTENSAGMKP